MAPRPSRQPTPRRLDESSRCPNTPAAAFVPAQDRSPETSPDPDPLAYSVDEAARLTGLSRDLLYDEMRRGHLATSRSAGGA
jgi:hypothetical protein